MWHNLLKILARTSALEVIKRIRGYFYNNMRYINLRFTLLYFTLLKD